MRGWCLVSAGLLVFLFVADACAQSGMFKVERPVAGNELRRVKDLRAARWLKAPIRDAASTRNLLRSSSRKFPQAVGAGDHKVLRLCGLRVEFESVPDTSKISGNGGRFDLSDKRSTVFIDPPPHNRKYFSKHMEALANYYRAMSYGQLEIQWEVFPLAEDGAYMLPGVEKYNPAGKVGSWDWNNLEVFFRDAIQAADRDPDLKFSDFDAFVVFHAGSDWQNDIRGDSPYDLPSFFISLAETIAVDDSTYFVVDGSVVPETSSQDGYLNGLNGVLAHEIGHQLGLPDLYDTQLGASVIGYWDLMDFGSGVGMVISDPRTQEPYYVTGVLPGSLSAWSKSYLGWVVPDTVPSEGVYSLPATELQGDAPNRGVLFVRLNSYEHYLVENRECDLDGDSTGILLADPSPDSTGVIMGPVNADRQFNYEYDWPLPGSGLLVWHVDEAMIKLADPYDMVNAFPARRGLTLEEADGIPDLGDYNSFYFLGSPYDPFFEGNNDRFADDTYPSTRSKTGCHSHVVMDGISEAGLAMTVRASNAWTKPGFPLALGDSLRFGVPSLMVADIDGDGRDELEAALKRAAWKDSLKIEGADTISVQYVEYSNSELYAFKSDAVRGPSPIVGWPRRLHGADPREIAGADLGGNHKLETVVTDETGWLYAFAPDGSPYFSSSDSLGAFVHPGGAVNGGPVAGDLAGDGHDDILVGTADGLIALSAKGRAAANTLFVIGQLGGASQPILGDFLPGSSGLEVAYYTPGEIDLASGSGARLASYPIGCSAPPGQVFLAAADLNRDKDHSFEFMVVTRSGWVWVTADGSPLPGWGKQVCEQVVGPPAFADINGDGYLEVVLTDRNNQTRAFTWNGSRVEGWPRTWFGCSLPEWNSDFFVADTTIVVPSAVIADLGSNARLDVIQGSLFECVTGWDPGGRPLEGFPVTMGGGCSALAVGDLEGDGELDMVSGGGDGNLYALSIPTGGGTSLGAPWRTAYFDRTRSCVYPLSLMPGPPVPGSELLVANSFHAFPNPVTSDVADFAFITETGGRATLEIFDLVGHRVKREDFDAVAKVEKSIDLSGLGNGLYVCRLRIEGDGKNASDFFKLAIKR